MSTPTPLTADTVTLAATLRRLAACGRDNPLLRWMREEMQRELRRRASIALHAIRRLP